MSEEMLSQEEIDALLSGGMPGSDDGASSRTSSGSEPAPLDTNDEEKFREVIESLLSTVSTVVSTILNTSFSFSLKEIKNESETGLASLLAGQNFSHNFIEFQKNLSGGFHFLIKKESVAVIADMMMGTDGTSPPEEINEIYLSAIDEAFNQMMGSSANSISSLIGSSVEIMPGKTKVGSFESLDLSIIGDIRLLSLRLKLGELLDSESYLIFTDNDYNDFQSSLNKTRIDSKQQLEARITPKMPKVEMPPPVTESLQSGEFPMQPQPPRVSPHPVKAPPPLPGGPQAIGSTGKVSQQPEIRPAPFTQIQYQQSRDVPSNIDLLMDVPLQLTVELGRKKMKIKEILELGSGSVIELEKLAGESVDVLVNNKLIAKGEVVVIDENFGIRITTITSASERLTNMVDF
ncbi:MAG: flagellar motor switch phosphatase FliY [Candidatus Wallbacteria bacterium]|nr:flagellar motor switch phosphatase FliY [Candidatus Wallbacteria bacterium]